MMTDNRVFKATVRRFADLNQVSYTTALRQFSSSGQPIYRMIQPKRNSPFSEVDWAKARGLKLGWIGCFHLLADPTLPKHQCSDRPKVIESRTWDHHREYTAPRLPGRQLRTPAAITFAPYSDWASTRLQDEVVEVAETYGLRFRIGFARDVAYGSGSCPIVFWNPDVFDPA
jgi:hypothetical protein